MPIETPRGLPFSVDTWSRSSKRKRHHFLTHAHKDHLTGIATFFSFPVYCTRLTKTLVRRQFPQLEESLFVEIELGEYLLVKDPDGDFSVRVFDANHCPGAVMFLFEGEFGNILHTGDCRLSTECLQNLPLKYINKKRGDSNLDYLFLDCTFGSCSIEIPSKKLAIQQVINCIWKHPNAPVVYLACDMLGQEDVLVQVSKSFGSRIYVDKINNPGCYHILSLVAPDILSNDATSRFQLVEGFSSLNERASKKIAEARAKSEAEPLYIRPSTQWYATHEMPHKLKVSEAERDEWGVWHVCYSVHSSRPELEWALQILHPKWVISTTPPCRAMELDYVKNHCYKTRIAHDDPIWKLFKGTVPNSKDCITAYIKEFTIDRHKSDKLEDSSSVTLFGRARLREQHANTSMEKKRYCPENNGVVPNMKKRNDDQFEKYLEEDEDASCEIGISYVVGSSKNMNEALRRLYRSRNVPVPRPIPSVVELMNSIKRVRTGSGDGF